MHTRRGGYAPEFEQQLIELHRAGRSLTWHGILVVIKAPLLIGCVKPRLMRRVGRALMRR